MSFEQFDDNCPGCRPAILDLETRKPLPDDHPVMVKMLAIWANTTLGERRAFHRVMCLNSRDAIDLFIVRSLTDKLEAK